MLDGFVIPPTTRMLLILSVNHIEKAVLIFPGKKAGESYI